jgi:signal transduction histidine kinase
MTRMQHQRQALEQANTRLRDYAVTLTVHLAREDHGIRLTVRDDRQGFDPHNLETTGHYGLKGMHERAALSGGALSVESRPGAGTEVQLRI